MTESGEFFDDGEEVYTVTNSQLEEAVLAERERCAKIAESALGAWEQCGSQIAETIRRGPTSPASSPEAGQQAYSHRPVTRDYCEVMLYDSNEIIQRLARAYIALLDSQRVHPDTERLLNVAMGCHDYGGGYRGSSDIEQAQSDAFHHGIQTVINALEAAVKNNPDNWQVAMLESMGAAARGKTQQARAGQTAPTLLGQAIEALKAYEALDNQHANCEECDGEEQPEACEVCFPFADDARLKMRAVLANPSPQDHHAAICADSDPCQACGPKQTAPNTQPPAESSEPASSVCREEGK